MDRVAMIAHLTLLGWELAWDSNEHEGYEPMLQRGGTIVYYSEARKTLRRLDHMSVSFTRRPWEYMGEILFTELQKDLSWVQIT